VDIEWDPAKAASNLKKHGVSFEEAATVLFDPNALSQPDESSTEERWLLMGLSSEARLITLVYTLRGEDRIRLISARKATRKEAKHYA
jgi:uncharacterized DUF497 family protein